MLIRKATNNDVKILNNFLTLLIRDEKQYDEGINEDFVVTNMYENYIDDSDKLLIVAVIDEKIVGYLYAKLRDTDITYKFVVAKLDALYVMDNYRNRGIGLALIDYFKKWAIQKRANKLEVNVWSDNIKAKRLYEKANFKTASETLIIDNLPKS